MSIEKTHQTWFHSHKSTDPTTKDGRRSHGIFTYYFSKIIYDDPSISPRRLVERLNGFIGRFGNSVSCDSTSPSVMDESMYCPIQNSADPNAKDPIDEIIEEEDHEEDSTEQSVSD